MLALGWRAPRKAREFDEEVARSCTTCAAPSPQMTRNVCGEARACNYVADFPPKAHALRGKTRAKTRAFSRKACNLGKSNCARLLRACGVIAANDAKRCRRDLCVFAPDFAPNTRAPRAKQMQNCARSAGVDNEKHAISTRKLREVAPRVQRRRQN